MYSVESSSNVRYFDGCQNQKERRRRSMTIKMRCEYIVVQCCFRGNSILFTVFNDSIYYNIPNLERHTSYIISVNYTLPAVQSLPPTRVTVRGIGVV